MLLGALLAWQRAWVSAWPRPSLRNHRGRSLTAHARAYARHPAPMRAAATTRVHCVPASPAASNSGCVGMREGTAIERARSGGLLMLSHRRRLGAAGWSERVSHWRAHFIAPHCTNQVSAAAPQLHPIAAAAAASSAVLLTSRQSAGRWARSGDARLRARSAQSAFTCTSSAVSTR